MDFTTQVYNSGSLKAGESVLMLLYGAAGTGKTEFCGSIGSDGLIINTGSGMETLTSPTFRAKYKTFPDIIDVVDNNIFDKDDKGNYLAAVGFDKVTDIIDWALKNDKYKTICLDDSTFFNRYARNRALEINSSTNKSNSLGTSRAQGIAMMAIQDYGTEMGAIEWFLAEYIPLFKACKKNFIMTAHEKYWYRKKEKPTDADEIIKVSPAFTGKSFPDTVPAFFDIIWRFKCVGSGTGIKYRAYTVGGEDETGKTRYSGVFKPIEENPNFPDVIARIKGEKLNAKV